MELIGVLVLDISLLTVGDYNETSVQVTTNIGGGPKRGERDENVNVLLVLYIMVLVGFLKSSKPILGTTR